MACARKKNVGEKTVGIESFQFRHGGDMGWFSAMVDVLFDVGKNHDGKNYSKTRRSRVKNYMGVVETVKMGGILWPFPEKTAWDKRRWGHGCSNFVLAGGMRRFPA